MANPENKHGEYHNKFTPFQQQWLAALESGDWQQCQMKLCIRTPEGDKHCCLGVAAKLLGLGEHEDRAYGHNPEKVTVEFFDKYSPQPHSNPYEAGNAPSDVIDQLHLVDKAGSFQGHVLVQNSGSNGAGACIIAPRPYYMFNSGSIDQPPTYSALTALNDSGWTFKQIARLIRRYPWLVFTNFDIPSRRPYADPNL